jgi:mRNA interferase MazF
LKRGDVVTIALSGEFKKPRPAVVVETDKLAPTGHVVICPGTSHLRHDVSQRRVHVEPSETNGLRLTTQFQVDKITVIRREKCGAVIGTLEAEAIERLNGVLFSVLGLAG